MDYKMWVLSGHYQGTRNFTFESLEGAKARRLAWRNRIAECYQKDVVSDGSFDRVLEAVENNLNSAEAFAVIDGAVLSLEDWQKVDVLFGLRLIEDTPDIDEATRELITERQKARDARDFARADELRDKLAEKGITVRDTADGGVWEYLK